ncbi:pentatricopeptide repeat domain-containing protein 3, mitochondrial-like [Anneissia japonica]|uniref:pentatricopeptide repeat domain-containing protein 3, mitochondrial-like n=1 Tax=Anneissia japonica TaxID=1529436 RepID=UPI001425763C|nr:pentatricopeptide repeat domain-containing protein 3, mitochondrial-like [Anneissia japonica]
MAAPIRCFCACSKNVFSPLLVKSKHVHLTTIALIKEVQTKEKIVIPKKTKRDSLTVLKMLSQTVGKDPTAFPYGYIDDPYLIPRTVSERRRFYLSKESGKRTARYVMSKYPQLFQAYQHDKPRIESYHLKTGEYTSQEPSEMALLERIIGRDVTEAVAMHKKLLDAGVKVSLSVNNELLDLLCYYDSQDPPSEFHDIDSIPEEIKELGEEEAVTQEVEVKEENQRWKDGNEAEQLFGSMEEKDSRSYNTMIRGMVKHQAFGKAFHLYNEMQEKDIKTDVHAYTSLVHAAAFIRYDHGQKWQIIEQLLKQMQLEGVRPNLLTFNTVLERLLRMGGKGRQKAVPLVSEMKAIGVEPSLGTYGLLVNIFYKDNLPPTDMLYDIMDTIEGQHFTIQHKSDVFFFKNAMDVCFKLKDVELAYRVDELMNTKENYRLLGDNYLQNIYYSKFLHLICSMDGPENMIAYYGKLVPSVLYPNSTIYIELLRSLETAMSYSTIPAIWQDISNYGQRYRQELVNTILEVMANAVELDSEVKEEFVKVARDVMKAFEESLTKRDTPLRWSASNLSHVLIIFIQGQDLKLARQVLQIFQQNQIIPSPGVVETFVDACMRIKNKDMAYDILKLAVSNGLTLASSLSQRIKTDFDLSDVDKKRVEDMLMEADLI